MDPVGAVVVFIITWWLSLFVVLPIGVRGQFEDGDVIEGSEEGAPSNPMMKKKVIWATIGAIGATFIIHLIVTFILN